MEIKTFRTQLEEIVVENPDNLREKIQALLAETPTIYGYHPVEIRFEYPAENHKSITLGPYPWAQITYDILRASVEEEDDFDVAVFDGSVWVICEGAQIPAEYQNQEFSDVIIAPI